MFAGWEERSPCFHNKENVDVDYVLIMRLLKPTAFIYGLSPPCFVSFMASAAWLASERPFYCSFVCFVFSPGTRPRIETWRPRNAIDAVSMNCPSIPRMQTLTRVALCNSVAHYALSSNAFWVKCRFSSQSFHFIDEKIVRRTSLGSNWHHVLLFRGTINKISQVKDVWNHRS